MGYGYDFECENCHHKYDVFVGSGASYQDVYHDVIRKIVTGFYGKRWSDVFSRTPYATVKANNFIYICDYCQHWISEKDVTLYVPRNPDTLPPQLRKKYMFGYAISTVPYVSEEEIKTSYIAYRRFFHYCAKCGRRMHKAQDYEENVLSCPSCGTINEAVSRFFWD